MRMKNIRRYLGLTLLMFAVMVMSSCIKENLPDSSSEKVNVTLNFDTRGGETASVDTEKGEGIKTLRVIITDENDKVIENIWKVYSSESLTTSKNLTVMGLEEGKKRFYVVINEGSIGLSKYLESITTEIPSDFLKKVIKNNVGNSYFPRIDSRIGDYGIPATGMKEVNLSKTNNNFTIQCTHAVIKVEVNIKNLMNVPCPISAINFGEFVPDATYLFDNDKPDADIKSVEWPEEASISSLDYNEVNGFSEVNLPANMSDFQKVLVFYMYEPKVTKSDDFSIALTAEGYESLSTPKSFISQTEIPRNSLLKINATIDLQTEVMISKLSYEVLGWNSASVKVPGFN